MKTRFFQPQIESLESRITPSGGKPAPKPEYTLTDLGVLAGHTGSTGIDVNSNGLVVGQSYSVDVVGSGRAFLVVPRDINGDDKLDWYDNAGNVPNSTNNLMTALMTITGPTFSHSIARGISDSGQVVGAYHTTTGEVYAFLITPRDMNSDGKIEWNWDANVDGVNDLMTNRVRWAAARLRP